MKPFIFVSDFDGTISKKDFYKILMDKYYKETISDLYKRWRNKEVTDIYFLNYVYSNINRNENQILEDILSIELDEYFENFLELLKNSNGDFLILSAGTSYYIEKLFEYKGIHNINIISNKGIYKDSGVHLVVDEVGKYYSPIYGIDKGKVVSDLKNQYEKVYFAGDSGPDVNPSKAADIAFATSELKNLLNDICQPYVPFDSFRDIENYLISIGVINK